MLKNITSDAGGDDEIFDSNIKQVFLQSMDDSVRQGDPQPRGDFPLDQNLHQLSCSAKDRQNHLTQMPSVNTSQTLMDTEQIHEANSNAKPTFDYEFINEYDTESVTPGILTVNTKRSKDGKFNQGKTVGRQTAGCNSRQRSMYLQKEDSGGSFRQSLMINKRKSQKNRNNLRLSQEWLLKPCKKDQSEEQFTANSAR